MPRLVAALLLVLLAASVCLAADQSQAEKARQELSMRLQRLLVERDAAEGNLLATRRLLRRLGQSLADEKRQTEALQTRLQQAGLRQKQLESRIALLSSQVSQQKKLYAQRMRRLYLWGPDASMHLLASSSDYQQALSRSRTLVFLLRYELMRLDQLDRKRVRLHALEREAAMVQADCVSAIQGLRKSAEETDRLLARQKELEQQHGRRAAALESSIKAVREAQARLLRNFALLQPAGGPGVSPAASPVDGKVETPGDPNLKGVYFVAGQGARVRTPWAGKVVYAAMLQGYGKVVVVDHGDRMHTVLANLDTLSVHGGQELSPGQVVGAVGPSGRLYLEVRKQAKAVDPRNWLGLSP